MSSMVYSDVTLIVPTLNEEKNIPELISIVRNLYSDLTIIVADDGSTDKTQAIVRKLHKKDKRVHLLDRGKEEHKGITASVVDAVGKCKTKFFVVIDGDLQHPPEKVKEIIASLKKGNKVVIGTRKEVASDWPWHRKLMSKTAIWMGYVRLFLTGARATDIMSGFFGGDATFFLFHYHRKSKSFVLAGYKVLFDLLKIIPKDTPIGEVLYIFGARQRGTSKIGSRHIIAYLKSLFT